MANLGVPYVLVYQDDANVLSISSEVVKSSLDGAGLRLGVHNKEILL